MKIVFTVILKLKENTGIQKNSKNKHSDGISRVKVQVTRLFVENLG